MRLLAAAACAAMLIAGLAQNVGATDCTTSGATPCTNQQLLDAVRTRLGASLSDALAIQQELTFSLSDNRHAQDSLHDQIVTSEERLVVLDAEIAQLQVKIDATTRRIEVERAELVTLARTIWTEPTSFLVLAARARDLGEVFTRTSDLIAAGARARGLKVALQHDLETLNADMQRQQAARDAEATIRQELVLKHQRLGDVA